MPQISTNTFAYSAINEGNRLENSIKGRVNQGSMEQFMPFSDYRSGFMHFCQLCE